MISKLRLYHSLADQVLLIVSLILMPAFSVRRYNRLGRLKVLYVFDSCKLVAIIVWLLLSVARYYGASTYRLLV